ncbi:DNA repair protein RadC [Magnetovibrio sp. PR-2]|uniref:RadC family protein n=1 Tax=Magnetovibrio sp. PR-2 TaxID=3120356 RepID=UPI002FCE4151
MPDTPQSTPHYTGHRQRLRERFLKSRGRDLADYELLEVLLFAASPRRDVKPLAKALIDKFGSFGAVMNADADELQKVSGMGEVAAVSILAVRQSAERLLQDDVMNKPVLSNWQSLMDYCRVSMGSNKTEQFRVLFLNRQNVLIADELQEEGTVDQTPVYPRKVIKRALELEASALILVHNHPSGDPTPSQPDIDMTRELQSAGSKLGIQLHDHVIVSRSGNSSFKTMGLL